MRNEKKTWVVPELLVLSRSKPEESVLVACKIIYGAGASPGYSNMGCDQPCTLCDAKASS